MPIHSIIIFGGARTLNMISFSMFVDASCEGTDTTSSALARTFDLLSQHPDIQDRLREEVKGWESMSYDEIVTHPYLEAVCRETLRLYSPAQIVSRVFVQQSTSLHSR